MKIGDKIKTNRQALKLSQEEFGARLGVKKNAVSKWECGRVVDIPASKIKAMAEMFGVRPSYLVDDDMDAFPANILPMPSFNTVPRVGAIACGKPILAQENIEGYDTAPDWVKCDFSLTCEGDSMIGAGIHDGDIVFIKQQEEVENGQIAAVLINDEATLKRVRYIEYGVALWPENPSYEPLIYVGDEAKAVRIIGLATHCISVIK